MGSAGTKNVTHFNFNPCHFGRNVDYHSCDLRNTLVEVTEQRIIPYSYRELTNTALNHLVISNNIT